MLEICGRNVPENLEGEKEVSMNNLRKEIVMVLLTAILFCTGFVSGCMTIRGMASDIGDGARALEGYLDPVEQGRHAGR